MAFTFGYAIGPKLFGVDLTAIDAVAKHAVGSLAYDSKGRALIYVKANGTIAKGKFVKSAVASDPFTNVVIATASGAGSMVLGITPTALVAGNFAWIVQHGLFEDDAALVSASVANGDPLIVDASGNGTIATAADINNAVGICVVDDTDNTGTVFLY
jgi:hypothetical protein